jgi:hypothetical protein
MYKQQDAGGEVGKSTACPIRSVVDRKLKQWAREEGGA